MTKTSPHFLEAAKPEAADQSNLTPMINPTFNRLQGHRRRQRGSVLVTVGALVFVAAIGAAGLYALTRSNAAMGSAAPPTVSQMPSSAGGG